jgi:hypothetical protein
VQNYSGSSKGPWCTIDAGHGDIYINDAGVGAIAYKSVDFLDVVRQAVLPSDAKDYLSRSLLELAIGCPFTTANDAYLSCVFSSPSDLVCISILYTTLPNGYLTHISIFGPSA